MFNKTIHSFIFNKTFSLIKIARSMYVGLFKVIAVQKFLCIQLMCYIFNGVKIQHWMFGLCSISRKFE